MTGRVEQTQTVRIATWNLEGRWDQRHLDLITSLDCEILLLTEVSHKVTLPGLSLHVSTLEMTTKRHWAAVASRHPVHALPDPHGASAMAEVDGLRVCSSILPWRACGTQSPWVGANTADKTQNVVEHITASAPTIWGGDWNHAMAGREWSGSMRGRESIVEGIKGLGLQVPTAMSLHQIQGLLSIDHIAVPQVWTVLRTERHQAHFDGVQISDHDAYVVEVDSEVSPTASVRARRR